MNDENKSALKEDTQHSFSSKELFDLCHEVCANVFDKSIKNKSDLNKFLHNKIKLCQNRKIDALMS